MNYGDKVLQELLTKYNAHKSFGTFFKDCEKKKIGNQNIYCEHGNPINSNFYKISMVDWIKQVYRDFESL